MIYYHKYYSNTLIEKNKRWLMNTDPVLEKIQKRGINLKKITKEEIEKNLDLINLLADQDWRMQNTEGWSKDLKEALLQIRSQILADSGLSIDVVDFSYQLEVISRAKKIRIEKESLT